MEVCPLNAKVHYNIAKHSSDKGNKEKAIYEYQEAIRLYNDYYQAMNNLANILKDEGKLKQAKDLLMKALKINPTFSTGWMNLGIVQVLLKDYANAETSYLIALKHRKPYPDCLYNLGNLVS